MTPAVVQQRNAAKLTVVDRLQVDAVRRFNRFYTRQLGLLDKGYLSSSWTLTEVRVLYELARGSNVTAGEIAEELQLDVAYLSRILGEFEKKRLVKRTASRTDARRRNLTLTANGIAAFAPLDRSAAQQVTEMLAPLAEAERTTPVSAMRRVQGLPEGKAAAP